MTEILTDMFYAALMTLCGLTGITAFAALMMWPLYIAELATR